MKTERFDLGDIVIEVEREWQGSPPHIEMIHMSTSYESGLDDNCCNGHSLYFTNDEFKRLVKFFKNVEDKVCI